MASPGSYWGGHFPEPALGELSYWGGHFPEETTTDPGYGPATVGAFKLALDAGSQLTLQWQTDVRKSRSGVEQRANVLDLPRQFYRGPMFLVDAASRAARTELAQFAALGAPFLVGLSYEALAVTGAPTTAAVGAETHTTITVPSTTLIDWSGSQRVVIDNPGIGAVESVVVSITATTIAVNTDVSALAVVGARVMPGVATLLDPQQGFDRYPVAAEQWNVSGRAAVFGYAPELVAATLALTGPHTTGATLRALTLGPQGNYTRVRILTDAIAPEGEVTVGFTGYLCTVTIRIQTGVTTVAQLLDLVAGSGVIELDGTLTPTDVLGFGDLLPLTYLSGGASILPEVGQGATLTTFRDVPVWTAGINAAGTVPDSLQSMHEVEDLGGIPFAVGSADIPEWGRSVVMRRSLADRYAWQWLMRFLDEIRGRWQPFWLSTFAADLEPLTVAAGELVVSAGTGEVFARYPAQHECLQIVQADRSVAWVRITGATDNGDDTVTLTIVDEADAPVTLIGVPRMVSWLERCRLESDDVVIAFDAESRFTMNAMARVLREATEVLTQPREVFEIVAAAETYLLASGVVAIEVDGQTYEASPIQRAGLTVSNSSGDAALAVTIPTSHPLVERYVADGAPPSVTMTVRRHDAVLATTEIIWVGNVATMACNGNLATFTVPSRGAASRRRRLPVISASRSCAHVLYDDRCQVSRAANTLSTTITSIAGRVVRVASIGGNPDQWARYGDITFAGQSMLVTDQVGVELTLRTSIPGLAIGDAVDLAAGCDHDIATCSSKFDNVVNFGGLPSMPNTGEIRFSNDGLGILIVD